MKPSESHIEQQNRDLRSRILTYEEQVADSNERLCAVQDALERERLLREEMVRAEVARHLAEIEARAMRTARAEAQAELERRLDAREAMLADREESLRRIETEIGDRKSGITEEEAAAKARIAEDEAAAKRRIEEEESAAKTRIAEEEKALRESREKLAAEVRDARANIGKLREDAVREYMERCGNAKDLMIEKFLESMRELPGADPTRRERLTADFKEASEKSMEAVGNEVRRQIDATAASSRRKVALIARLSNLTFGRRSEKVSFCQDEWEEMTDKWLGDKLLTPEELEARRKSIAEHRRAKAILDERRKSESEKGHGKGRIPDDVPVSACRVLTARVVLENPDKYREVGKTVASTLVRHVSYTQEQTIRLRHALIDPLANPELPEMVTAELPEGEEPRGKYDSSVNTGVIVAKYVDHIPLARQEDISEREGCRINRSTMNDMVNECADLYLRPLFPLLEREVLDSMHIAADGVPMKVADNELRRTVNRYVTAIRSLDTGAVVFKSYINTEEDKKKPKKKSGRGKDVLREYLKNWKGRFILCDGYAGYDWLRELGKIICRCSAHARREFCEGLRENRAAAREVLMLFQMLYITEAYIRYALENGQMTIGQVCDYRRTYAEPVWIHIKAWCAQTLLNVPDGSQMKRACNYLLNHYDELTNYLDVPIMPIDNNGTERVIRDLVMGRKNYLKNQSEESLQRDSIIYSFFATCAVNDVDPLRWLQYVMDHFDSTPADKLHTLLPQHWIDTAKSVSKTA